MQFLRAVDYLGAFASIAYGLYLLQQGDSMAPWFLYGGMLGLVIAILNPAGRFAASLRAKKARSAVPAETFAEAHVGVTAIPDINTLAAAAPQTPAADVPADSALTKPMPKTYSVLPAHLRFY